MNIEKFIYNGVEIEFIPTQSGEVKINATQMCKAFGRSVSHFFKSSHNRNFIKALLAYGQAHREKNEKPESLLEKIQAENSSFAGICKVSDLYTCCKKRGTWVHRILAIKIAAWLDPNFEIWIYDTIDSFMNRYFNAQREAMLEKIRALQEKEARREALIAKSPEFAEYLEWENRERAAQKRRESATRGQYRQMKKDMGEVFAKKKAEPQAV